MLKTNTEALYQRLTGLGRGSLIDNAQQRNAILRACKNVRTKDYIFTFDLAAGATLRDTHATTANWHFILTGISCTFGDSGNNINSNDLPEVSVKFDNFAPSTQYGTEASKMGRVAAALVFGREGLETTQGDAMHLEETANVFYDLGQRFIITLEAKGGAKPCRGVVCLTGVEISNEALKNGEL